MLLKKPKIVDTGKQASLTTSEIQTNPYNPRQLFDDAPMQELRESIREMGVLMPLIVYRPAGSDRYLILDGERRYRCCEVIERETKTKLQIPCNIVVPPDPVANIVYMFATHKFRLDWELMPTARSLEKLIGEMTTREKSEPTDKELRSVTGLSDSQIARCRMLMSFPRDLQDRSLRADPSKRIPSNFWTEMFPVLQIAKEHIPTIVSSNGGEFGVARLYADKYDSKKIISVTEFRKIRKAFSVAVVGQDLSVSRDNLAASFTDPSSSISTLFNALSRSAGDTNNLLDAVKELGNQIGKVSPDLVSDVGPLRIEIRKLYERLRIYLENLPEEDPLAVSR